MAAALVVLVVVNVVLAVVNFANAYRIHRYEVEQGLR